MTAKPATKPSATRAASKAAPKAKAAAAKTTAQPPVKTIAAGSKVASVLATPKELSEKYRAHGTDTGSTEVQIALLSERIATLAKHLKEHAGDHDSRRGLLTMVGRRRRLLNYLKKDDLITYQKLIADLGLRK